MNPLPGFLASEFKKGSPLRVLCHLRVKIRAIHGFCGFQLQRPSARPAASTPAQPSSPLSDFRFQLTGRAAAAGVRFLSQCAAHKQRRRNSDDSQSHDGLNVRRHFIQQFILTTDVTDCTETRPIQKP
jgi:hypothetical protein